jgi:outer membrane protein
LLFYLKLRLRKNEFIYIIWRLDINSIRKSLFLLLLIFLTICSPGFSDESTAESGKKIITLKEALEQVLVSNLEIEQAAKDVAISQAQTNQSRADFYLPQISLSGSLTLTNEPNNPYSQAATTGIIYPQNYSLGVSVSKALFQGFILWNNMQIADKNLVIARITYDDKVNQIRFSLTTAFYQLLLFKEAYDLTQLTDKNLLAHLSFTEENFKRGKMSELDLLKAQVDYKSNVPKLIKAKNDYDLQKLTLCNIIGIQDTEEIEFSADWKEIEGMGMGDQNEDQLYQAVLAHDAALESADISIAQTELRKSNAGNELYPTLNASLSYRFISSRSSLQGLNPYWNLNLGLSFNLDGLFPFSKTVYSVQEMEQTVAKLKLSREQRVRDLTLQLKTQLLKLNELKANILAQEESKNLASKGLDLVEAEMKKGSSTPLSLEDAELAYRTAIYAYRQALFDYASGIWTLNYLKGE